MSTTNTVWHIDKMLLQIVWNVLWLILWKVFVLPFMFGSEPVLVLIWLSFSLALFVPYLPIAVNMTANLKNLHLYEWPFAGYKIGMYSTKHSIDFWNSLFLFSCRKRHFARKHSLGHFETSGWKCVMGIIIYLSIVHFLVYSHIDAHQKCLKSLFMFFIQ